MKHIFMMLFLLIFLVIFTFNFWVKIALYAVCDYNWYELIKLQDEFLCTDWKDNYKFIIKK